METKFEDKDGQQQLAAMVTMLKDAINAFAKDNTEAGKLDVFLIYTALAQTGFEVAYQALPNSDEDRQNVQAQVPLLSKGMSDFMVLVKNMMPVSAASDLVAAAQYTAFLGEQYQELYKNAEKQLAPEDVPGE